METLRDVMRNYPKGVSVVTVDAGDGPRGITVSSLTSVSLSPPLVLISIAQASESHDFIQRAGAFCVNVLSENQGSFPSISPDQISNLGSNFGRSRLSAETRVRRDWRVVLPISTVAS